VVVVYNQNIVEPLMKMSAAEWFKSKNQFLSDHRPDEVVVQGWEWTPNKVVPDQHVVYSAGARKFILFADYSTEGAHRASLDPRQPFHLYLDTLEFKKVPP
jgi:hypothetical protein